MRHGHWLAVAQEAEPPILAGHDPSAPMLETRANRRNGRAPLNQARAEYTSVALRDLRPWIFAVNALHHFAGPLAFFFDEARLALKPGGGLLTIGNDPHTDRDSGGSFSNFERRARSICSGSRGGARCAARWRSAGFAWTESWRPSTSSMLRRQAEVADQCIGHRTFHLGAGDALGRGFSARWRGSACGRRTTRPAAGCARPDVRLDATIVGFAFEKQETEIQKDLLFKKRSF